jgi:hypothetical protein
MRGIVIGVLLAACGGSGSGPLTREEATTACVLLDSCTGGDGINDCFTDLLPQLAPAVWRCVIAAGSDCAASRECVGISFARATQCVPACEGDVVLTCGAGFARREHCDGPFSTGASCLIDNFGFPTCATGVCTTASQTCDGSLARVCDAGAGIVRETDCAVTGRQCISGVCTSLGGGGACTDGPRHCAGTAVETCELGIAAQVDCPNVVLGSSCTPITAPFLDAYCGYDTACTPQKGTETCTGSTVNFCAAGVPAAVDCTALGFAQCIGGHCFTL